MKKARILSLIVMLCFAFSVSAQTSTLPKGSERIKAIMEQFKGEKGVDCNEFAKGSGLGLIKMMLRAEFGKEFLNGIVVVMIMEYGSASKEVADAVWTAVESLSPDFTPQELSDEIKEGQKMCSYYKLSDDGESMIGIVTLVESGSTKCLMYLGGKISKETKK